VTILAIGALIPVTALVLKRDREVVTGSINALSI
jgi:hypothetical protein